MLCTANKIDPRLRIKAGGVFMIHMSPAFVEHFYRGDSMKKHKQKEQENQQPEKEDLPFDFYPPLPDWQEL